MKKTISINIGGVIFHIEEDGYEKLKNYLGSIHKYFSSFADSKEILSDIEGRVAERFLNKQKVESKQVISLVDVDELISAMGTVADFEAIEQAEDIFADPLAAASPKTESQKETFTTGATAEPKTERTTFERPKKLYRDLRRKLLGGVAAGLGHYFTIDPLWVRLAFLFAVIGLPAGSGMLDLNMEDEFGSISGFMVVVYIAMWIAFPGSVALEEDTKIKKFYRNPDRKVVGGVAAGVASYFGVDLGVVRFLWVLSIFVFGTGVLIYIVLWVIAPAANTLTEKMEMQGEPITLSNIESNIKQSLNLEEKNGEENPVTKLLLFPFRAIALIIQALGKLLQSFGPILRISIGSLLVLTGASVLIGLVVAASIAFGLSNVFPWGNNPPMAIMRELPSSLVLSALLLTTIPFSIILILGLTLIANRKVINNTVWLTLAGLWIVGIIGSVITGGLYQKNFSKRDEIKLVDYYALPAGTLVLDQRDEDDMDEFSWDDDLSLTGYAGDSLRLEKEISARGSNKENARKNAGDLSYRVMQRDSVLLFDEEPVFAENGHFRDQKLRMTLFIPFERPFAMTRQFYFDRINYRDGVDHKYDLGDSEVSWDKLRWVMRRDSGLVCINLPEKYIRKNTENEQNTYDYESDESSDIDLGERGTHIKQFPVSDFRKLEIGGAYAIHVRQGAEYSVTADGEEEEVDDLKVYVENGTLHVKRNSGFKLFGNSWKRIGLIITMPTIESLDLSGANKTLVNGFTNMQKLRVDISGASKTELNVDVQELVMEVSGASKATLKGSAKSVMLDLSGACKLDATAMQVENADVDASGASKATFGHVTNLKKDTSGASKVESQE